MPRQNSSGGKTALGRITKHGDDYRMLHSRLQLEGWTINVKRAYRVYREEGLMVRKRRRKKLPRARARARAADLGAPDATR